MDNTMILQEGYAYSVSVLCDGQMTPEMKVFPRKITGPSRGRLLLPRFKLESYARCDSGEIIRSVLMLEHHQHSPLSV
jgi:hypothetical protein